MKLISKVDAFIGPTGGTVPPTLGNLYIEQTVAITPAMVGKSLTASARVNTVYPGVYESIPSIRIVDGNNSVIFTSLTAAPYASTPAQEMVVSVTLPSCSAGTSVKIQIGCINGDMSVIPVMYWGDAIYGLTVNGVSLMSNGNVPVTLVNPEMQTQFAPGRFTWDPTGWTLVSDDAFYNPSLNYENRNGAIDGMTDWGTNIFGYKVQYIPEWKTLGTIPGIQVLQGLQTTEDIDSKGHGHESDMIPSGTNFVVVVLTKGTDASNNPIDGFDALKDLNDHHNKVWEKIDDKLGGLIFFGSLSEDAKKQFKNLIKGYDQQYK